MAASYPTSVKTFSTKATNDTIEASHVNDPQDEVTAIEGALLNGFQHDLKFTDATYDIGKSGATRPRDVFLSRHLTVGGNSSLGTIVADLLFTDATYDIGKSGATRPRDGFFSRNVAVGGTLGVTGVTTLTGAATLSSADSTVKAGNSTETAKLCGIINVDSTQAGTGANTTDTLLFNYSLPANALDATGRTLRITAFGTFGPTANNKTVRLKWNNASGTGGDLAVTVTSASNGGSWRLVATVTKNGSNTQDVSGMAIAGTTVAAGYIGGTATESGAITIGVTSQNGTAAANDCVYEGSIIEFLN